MTARDDQGLRIEVKKSTRNYYFTPDDTYKMVRNPRGVCFIVSNEKFDALLDGTKNTKTEKEQRWTGSIVYSRNHSFLSARLHSD